MLASDLILLGLPLPVVRAADCREGIVISDGRRIRAEGVRFVMGFSVVGIAPFFDP
jgi:hypothetical protein